MKDSMVACADCVGLYLAPLAIRLLIGSAIRTRLGFPSDALVSVAISIICSLMYRLVSSSNDELIEYIQSTSGAAMLRS